MRVPAAIAVLVLCSGCWVMDEIDQGVEILESHSPKKTAEEPQASAPPAAAASKSKGPSAFDELVDWAQKKLEPAPPPPDPNDQMVRCAIGHREQFTARYDCAARGGRVIELGWEDSDSGS